MIMTDKQKEAILLLIDLYVNKHINEDKYFLLMEFVIGNQEVQVWNTPPYITPVPQPIDPIYGKFGKVTCDQYKAEVILTEKEKQQ